MNGNNHHNKANHNITTNISVLSLLNSSPHNNSDKQTIPYTQTSPTHVTTSITAATNIISSLLKSSLPTVTNTNLLYKSIVTSKDDHEPVKSPNIPPLANLLNRSQQITPLSNDMQVLKTIISTTESANSSLNSVELISPRSKFPAHHVEGLAQRNAYISNQSLNKLTAFNLNSVSLANGPSNATSSDKYKAILVPRGWNRTLDKDSITYISPNRSRLRSREDLVHYLTIEGTCKCGLECPLNIDEVFNFDTKVASKFGINSETGEDCKCKTHQKFLKMFPPSVKLKVDRRGRKPGQKTKRESSDDCTSPDRKRISLTGVSPLEMFQSGMNAINSMSPFTKKETIKVKKLGSSNQLPQILSKSLPQSEIVKLADVVSSVSVLASSKSLSPVTTSITKNSIINSLPAFSNSQMVNTNAAAYLKQKRPKKVGTSKGRGAGKTTQEKKNLRKALPDVEIQKASELQLHHNIVKSQGKTIIVDPKSGKQVGAIPTLRNISSIPKSNVTEQLLNAHSILTNQTTQTITLQSIYRTLQAAAANQVKKTQVATSHISPSPSKSSTVNKSSTQSENKTGSNIKGHVIVSMPPNLTVSSANHLNEALLNQLTSKNFNNANALPSQFLKSPETLSSSVPILTRTQTVSKVPVYVTSSSIGSYNYSSHSTESTKQVNVPIQTNINNQAQSQPAVSASNGPMLLLHFVSQPNLPTVVNPGKMNSSVLRTYSVNNQSNLPSTIQSNILVMNKKQNSNNTQTARQGKPSDKKTNQENKSSVLQIQNMSLQSLSTQLSPSCTGNQTVSTIPVHYVQTVNPSGKQQGLKISQTLGNTIPLFQYLQTSSPFLYSGSTTKKTASASPTNNFVRIAPGPSTGENPASALIQQIEKHNNEELRRIQEELFRNPTTKSQSKTFSTKNDQSTSSTKTSMISVIRNTQTSPNVTPPLRLTSYVSKNDDTLTSFQNTQKIFSASKSNISATIFSKTSASLTQNLTNLVSVIATPSSFVPTYVPLSNSLKSKNYPRPRVHSVPPTSHLMNEELRRRDSLDEMLLKCNEKPISNCSEDVSRHPPAATDFISYNRSLSTSSPSAASAEVSKQKNNFASSLVWIDSPGSPPWPGRMLSATQLRKSELPSNQVYVAWYGSHHVQPVNIHSLKTFFDSDLSLHYHIDDPKYRGDTSHLTEHEKAIAEALQDAASMKQH